MRSLIFDGNQIQRSSAAGRFHIIYSRPPHLTYKVQKIQRKTLFRKPKDLSIGQTQTILWSSYHIILIPHTQDKQDLTQKIFRIKTWKRLFWVLIKKSFAKYLYSWNILGLFFFSIGRACLSEKWGTKGEKTDEIAISRLEKGSNIGTRPNIFNIGTWPIFTKTLFY